MYRFNIYYRNDSSESWQHFHSEIASHNHEPIREPWDVADLSETLDDYVQVSDGQWYATLTSDDPYATLRAETPVLDRNIGEWLDY